jgi:hypothetical protein
MEVHCMYTNEDSTMKPTKHIHKGEKGEEWKYGGDELVQSTVCMYRMITMKSP